MHTPSRELVGVEERSMGKYTLSSEDPGPGRESALLRETHTHTPTAHATPRASKLSSWAPLTSTSLHNRRDLKVDP